MSTPVPMEEDKVRLNGKVYYFIVNPSGRAMRPGEVCDGWLAETGVPAGFYGWFRREQSNRDIVNETPHEMTLKVIWDTEKVMITIERHQVDGINCFSVRGIGVVKQV